jgi:hypothetical protein
MAELIGRLRTISGYSSMIGEIKNQQGWNSESSVSFPEL